MSENDAVSAWMDHIHGDPKWSAVGMSATAMGNGRPPRVRPPRGYAFVTRLPAESLAQMDDAGGIVIPERANRAPSVWLGRVLAVGTGMPDDVTPGVVVVVETRSGHPHVSERACDTLAALFGVSNVAVVPALRLPSFAYDDELAARTKSLKALNVLQQRMRDPIRGYRREDREKGQCIDMEIAEHTREIMALRALRKSCARSKLFKPGQDVAQAEGILAVVEYDS